MSEEPSSTPIHSPPMDRVEIQYKESEDYRLLTADNVHGGRQPRGNLKLDFSIDYHEDPDRETYSLSSAGQLGEKLDMKGGDSVIREKQVGVFLSMEHAFSIGSWMLSNLVVEEVEDGYKQVSEDEITEILLENFEFIPEVEGKQASQGTETLNEDQEET